MASYISSLFLTGIICLAVAIYAWRHKGISGADSFAVLMIDAALFVFAFALQATSTRLEQAIFWGNWMLPFSTFFAPLWLFFTLQYTRQRRWLKKPFPHILFVSALVFVLIGLTNPLHGLYARNYWLEVTGSSSALKSNSEIAYSIFLVYTYLLLLTGIFLLIKTSVKTMRPWQIAVLVIGGFAPIAGNLLFMLPDMPVMTRNLTPLSLGVTCICWSAALFQVTPTGHWFSKLAALRGKTPVEPEHQPAHNHMEATLNALPDLMFDMDREGRIYDFRAPWQNLLYVPPEQFLGKRMADVLPPEAAQVILGAIQQAGEQGWHRGASYSLDLPTGTAWFELSVQAVGDWHQPNTHFIALVRDITERIEMQDRLLQSEERFHNLVKQSRDGIFLTDEQGIIIEWNQSTEQMIGISAQDALGKPLWDVQFLLLDKDQRTFTSYQMMKEWITSFLRTGEVPFENKMLEQQYDHPSGKRRTIQTVYFSITSTKGYLLCGFIRDITDKKESEEKLRRQNAYLEALHDTTLDLISHLDTGTLLENIVRRAGSSLGTSHGFIDLVKQGSNELEPKVKTGIMEETAIYITRRGEGLAGKVWLQAQPLAVNNYDDWEGRLPEFAKNKIRAMVGIPLISRSRVIGVLGLAHPADSERTFQAEDIQFLEQFARLASVALDNAWLFAATNELLAHEQHLKEVAQLLSSSLDLSKTLDTFMHLTVQLVDADAGLLGVFTPDRQNIHYPYRYNLPADLSLPQVNQSTDKRWRTGSLANYDDQNPDNLPAEIRQEWLDAGIQYFIMLPVSAGQEQIGILWLFTLEKSKRFSERQLTLAQAAGQQAALAIQNAQRFKNEQNQRLRQTILFRLSTRLGAAAEECDIWQQVAEGLHDPTMNYRYIVLLELDPITGERIVRGHVGWDNAWLGRRLAPGQGLSERPLLDGQPHYSPDITLEQNYILGPGQGSEADIPIWIERELVGVLTIEDQHLHAFSAEDMEVFISAAYQAGLALGQARLLKRTQKHVNEMQAMNVITQKLHARLDLDSMLTFVGEQLIKMFNVQGTYISLYDQENDMLHFPFWHLPDENVHITSIQKMGGLTAKIFATCEPLLINQDYDRHFKELGGKKLSGAAYLSPKSWLGAPILVNHQPVGIICIQNYQRENAFTVDEVNLLQALAANVGVAIQNARLYSQVQEELQERQRAEAQLRQAFQSLEKQLEEITQLQGMLRDQAIRDPLTGLFNRRYLRETLPREVANALREGYPIGIMIMDLDHFKNINDTYGHDAGDAVLEYLGRVLVRETRAGDIVCRYGGEEIVIVLPRASQEDTRRRAETIRALLETSVVEYQNRTISARVSIGVAAFPVDGASGDEILIRADRALYYAKQNGRNQVQVYAQHILK